jgi:hypothetical protein
VALTASFISAAPKMNERQSVPTEAARPNPSIERTNNGGQQCAVL